MSRRPALLEDGQLSACDHDWLGLGPSAIHELRFDAGPAWSCQTCQAYTRSLDVVYGPGTAARHDAARADRIAAYHAHAANGYRRANT
jgi:hypothetical protein